MIIYISKGRIFDICKNFLKKKKIFIEKKSRKLILRTNVKNLYIVQFKSNDLVKYLNEGLIDNCIMGSDVYYEYNLNNEFKKKKINIFKCRISIISKNNHNKKNIKVFSKYINISKKYFKKKNIKAKFSKFNGNLELNVIAGFCDYITDIVETGKTIKVNKLKELKSFFKVRGFFVFNKKIKKKKKKIIKNIFNDTK
ncbi:ATP phosphoribosyltransferase [Candidatus Vidania fulgoroideorum]